MHDHLIGIFPQEIRQPTLTIDDLSVVGGGAGSEPAAVAAEPDADVHQSPFPASSGFDEDVEDMLSRPESVTEIDILKKLLSADFSPPCLDRLQFHYLAILPRILFGVQV